MTFVIGTPHTHNCGNLSYVNGGSDQRRREADIKTCTHCQKVIDLANWKQNGAWCARCNAPVCAEGPCAAATEKYGCLPFIARIEREFEIQGKLEAFRKLAGLDPSPAQPLFTGVTHG